MVAYPQHERAVTKLKTLATELGCKVLENDSGPWGAGGFRFPRQETGRGAISWIADAYIDYKGHRIILEVDGKKGHRTPAQINVQKYRKDFMIYHYGIPTVRFDLPLPDWLDAAMLQKEIEHTLAQAQRLENYARVMMI